ncbi:hypothetical protein BDN67DRAFT_981123 [Paxillus ammoniavirescens]|nr:hypothetical protein BDN67DRAFT_981123 [Paxillus ammoniavirescens]
MSAKDDHPEETYLEPCTDHRKGLNGYVEFIADNEIRIQEALLEAESAGIERENRESASSLAAPPSFLPNTNLAWWIERSPHGPLQLSRMVNYFKADYTDPCSVRWSIVTHMSPPGIYECFQAQVCSDRITRINHKTIPYLKRQLEQFVGWSYSRCGLRLKPGRESRSLRWPGHSSELIESKRLHSISTNHLVDFTLKLHPPTGSKASGSISKSLNAVTGVSTLLSARAGSDDKSRGQQLTCDQNVPNAIPCDVLRRYRTASTSEDVVILVASMLQSSSILIGYVGYVGCGPIHERNVHELDISNWGSPKTIGDSGLEHTVNYFSPLARPAAAPPMRATWICDVDGKCSEVVA